MSERFVTIAKAYESGKVNAGASLIIVIPAQVRKLINVENGQFLAVKIDNNGRLIYEPMGYTENQK